MSIKFNKRGLFKRVFGIPATNKPANGNCWSYTDGKLTIDLDDASELLKPGSAMRLEGKNLPQRVLVVHGEDGDYRAFHNRCSHIGHRRLDPVAGTDTVQCCSVNKSTYDAEGKKIFGPAPHPVTRFPVEKIQNKLVVSILP
ncbi:MAG: Rieske (2Fe-2S) protein [Desulfatitalea sp.]|nr:Rieske (2Fe-2S) protein [Desulfatitalea sp.]NNK02729.1 Rieske (2Fe-2S) protein [Desulfatitalea sp.]